MDTHHLAKVTDTKAEVGTRLKLSKYEMKLGAEDKSNNGVQVFVFFSTRRQKSKYALPTCILKSNRIGPVKGGQVDS